MSISSSVIVKIATTWISFEAVCQRLMFLGIYALASKQFLMAGQLRGEV